MFIIRCASLCETLIILSASADLIRFRSGHSTSQKSTASNGFRTGAFSGMLSGIRTSIGTSCTHMSLSTIEKKHTINVSALSLHRPSSKSNDKSNFFEYTALTQIIACCPVSISPDDLPGCNSFLFSYHPVRPIGRSYFTADAAYTVIHVLGSLRTTVPSLLLFGHHMV